MCDSRLHRKRHEQAEEEDGQVWIEDLSAYLADSTRKKADPVTAPVAPDDQDGLASRPA